MAKNNKTIPSTNGANGNSELETRNDRGRFLPGNPGGPGNPHAAAVGAWRAVMVNTIAADDVRQVIGVLIDKAKAGEPWAVKELLDRCLGRAQQKMELEATGEKTWAMMLACLQTAADNQASEQ